MTVPHIFYHEAISFFDFVKCAVIPIAPAEEGGGGEEWRGSVFKLIVPLNNLTGKLKSTSVNKCIIRFSSICKLHLMHGSNNPTRKTRGVLGSRHTPSR